MKTRNVWFIAGWTKQQTENQVHTHFGDQQDTPSPEYQGPTANFETVQARITLNMPAVAGLGDTVLSQASPLFAISGRTLLDVWTEGGDLLVMWKQPKGASVYAIGIILAILVILGFIVGAITFTIVETGAQSERKINTMNDLINTINNDPDIPQDVKNRAIENLTGGIKNETENNQSLGLGIGGLAGIGGLLVMLLLLSAVKK